MKAHILLIVFILLCIFSVIGKAMAEEAPVYLINPVAIAFDKNDHAWIVDETNRVQEFDNSGWRQLIT